MLQATQRAAIFVLKRVLQGKLDLAIVGCGVRYCRASRYIYCNQRPSSRQTEVRMVEEIEELGAEFDLMRLPNFEFFFPGSYQYLITVNSANQGQNEEMAKKWCGGEDLFQIPLENGASMPLYIQFEKRKHIDGGYAYSGDKLTDGDLLTPVFVE